MSDLSKHRAEVPITSRWIAGKMCADCIPVVERSDWPHDAVNLPTRPDQPWPEGIVRVVNITHAATCPAFNSAAAAGDGVRYGTRYTALPPGSALDDVLFRETQAGRPTDVPEVEQ